MAETRKVDTCHPDHEASRLKWDQARDCYKGEDAVKERGERYLPRLGGQSQRHGPQGDDYESYKARAVFFNAVRRTVSGLGGAALQKAPRIQVPDSIKSRLEAMTSDGKDLPSFTRKIFDEVLLMGRVGVLVDVAGKGGKPYATWYRTEDVINWRTRGNEAGAQLEMVVLKECYLEWKNEFESEKKERYRVLLLDPSGLYHQKIFTRAKASGKDKWEVRSVVPKTAGGRTLNYIPFTFVNPSSTSESIEDPPMLDLSALNLSHWRNSADREHALHFTALPTAWVAGFDPETTELRIGSQIAWVSKNEQAKAGYLEFTGQGIAAIEKAMLEKKAEMAVLGARLLEEQKRQPESGEALRLRHRGEQSTLSEIADSVSEAIRKALAWLLDFTQPGLVTKGEPPASVVFEIQKDFLTTQIAPEMVDRLSLLLADGYLSYEQFFFNLQRGGIYKEGHTLEDELKAIDENVEVARRFAEKASQGGSLAASGELPEEV